MANTKKAHFVLTVTAHLVDIWDSDAKQSGDNITNSGYSVDTRPCLSCTGIDLGDTEELNDADAAAVQQCLTDLGSQLEDMLAAADKTIRKQLNLPPLQPKS